MRRRWVYFTDEQGKVVSIEVGNEWRPTSHTEAVDQYVEDHRLYGSARATDGTPIDSRTKHREYMRRNHLTTVDDFTNVWASAERQRMAYRGAPGTHHPDRSDIRRSLDWAWHKHFKR